MGGRVSHQLLLAESSGMSDETAVTFEKMPPRGKTYLVMSHLIGDRSSGNNNHDSLRAVILLYVDTDSFLKPMLYTGGGLGETGEIVLVNQDNRILISLKYLLPDGTVPKVLEYRVTTKPAALAVQGQEGVITDEDYRGVPILAAYRHIKVSGNTSWGMVVKQDQSEIFGPVHRMAFYSALIGIFALIGVALLAILVAKRLSQPVENLTHTAQAVSGGNLAIRAEVIGSDEVGALPPRSTP